jgi:hypothetical protein
MKNQTERTDGNGDKKFYVSITHELLGRSKPFLLDIQLIKKFPDFFCFNPTTYSPGRGATVVRAEIKTD